MAAQRKYDQETRDRAVRMFQDRRREFPNESVFQSRKRVGRGDGSSGLRFDRLES